MSICFIIVLHTCYRELFLRHKTSQICQYSRGDREEVIAYTYVVHVTIDTFIITAHRYNLSPLQSLFPIELNLNLGFKKNLRYVAST